MPLPTEAQIIEAVDLVKRLHPEQLILVSTTWIDLAKAVAADLGFDLTDEQADDLLWEHTGFPCFWTDPVRDCINQLRAYFFSIDDCIGDDDGPTP